MVSKTSATLRAKATDEWKVMALAFYLDDQQIEIPAITPNKQVSFSYAWNLAQVENGTHTARLVATDTSGNIVDMPVSFTVAK